MKLSFEAIVAILECNLKNLRDHKKYDRWQSFNLAIFHNYPTDITLIVASKILLIVSFFIP